MTLIQLIELGTVLHRIAHAKRTHRTQNVP